MRRGVIDRRTTETQIALSITLDGKGRYQVHSGIRFLDHMLELVARHGAFDLRIDAKGDLDVDQHHTVEDLGIALGEAVSKALGDRRGINRAGYFVMPMDETLAVAALDLSGRPHAVVDLKTRVSRVGDLQTGLVPDIFARVELAAATCRPNSFMIFSKGSRSGRARTFMSRFCTGARAIITLRQSSRRSPA